MLKFSKLSCAGSCCLRWIADQDVVLEKSISEVGFTFEPLDTTKEYIENKRLWTEMHQNGLVLPLPSMNKDIDTAA